MTIVLIILTLCLGVAFYFINALINRWSQSKEKIKTLEEKVKEQRAEIDDLYDRIDGLTSRIDLNETNINAAACANLNLRNDIGKLGNRIQNIERKEEK